MKEFSGKVALITGSASGIGRRIAAAAPPSLRCIINIQMAAVLLAGGSAVAAAAAPPAGDSSAAAQARNALHLIIRNAHGFEQVHAAEVLIAYGEGAPMRRLLEEELVTAETSPYRVGVWRALAAAAPGPLERAVWIEKIERVFLDSTAPDHLSAAESLCKLGERLTGAALQTARERAASGADGVFPCWVLAVAGEPEGWRRLTDMLSSSSDRTRMLAAFALSWLRPDTPSVLAALASAADRESPGTVAYSYLLSTAAGLRANPARVEIWRAEIDRILPRLSSEALYDAFHALLPLRTRADLPRLLPLLDARENDTRVAAAWTILSIVSRPPDTHFSPRLGYSGCSIKRVVQCQILPAS
jgi:hypothetical protein